MFKKPHRHGRSAFTAGGCYITPPPRPESKWRFLTAVPLPVYVGFFMPRDAQLTNNKHPAGEDSAMRSKGEEDYYVDAATTSGLFVNFKIRSQ